jgi:hypothetical protein
VDLFGTMEWTTPPTLETAATSTDNGGGRRRHPQAMPVEDDGVHGGHHRSGKGSLMSKRVRCRRTEPARTLSARCRRWVGDGKRIREKKEGHPEGWPGGHIRNGRRSPHPRFIGRSPRTAAMRPLRTEEAMEMRLGRRRRNRGIGFEGDSGGSRLRLRCRGRGSAHGVDAAGDWTAAAQEKGTSRSTTAAVSWGIGPTAEAHRRSAPCPVGGGRDGAWGGGVEGKMAGVGIEGEERRGGAGMRRRCGEKRRTTDEWVAAGAMQERGWGRRNRIGCGILGERR